MLVVNVFALSVVLFVSFSTAAPVADDRDNTTGSACSQEGKVMCYTDQFRTCASGVWSAKMSLAQGTTCNLFSVDSSGSPGKSTSPAASSSPSAEAYVHQFITITTTTKPGATFSTASYKSQTSSSPPAVSTYYSGTAFNFPAQSLWLSFSSLWDFNKAVCELNPDGLAQLIHDDILQVASESSVDSRVIFAVILQESTCQLSAVTTNNGVNNPGLMQSHNGVGYTDKASVLQMIKDGTEGTHYKGVDGGDGIQQLIAKYGVYGGLRAYNSGDLGLNNDDLSLTNAGTPSYVSDVANRLIGAKIAH